MITFRFLISLVLFEKLDMRLMDIVTPYLYGSLDLDIYMKISEGFKMPDACTPRNLFSIKQSGPATYLYEKIFVRVKAIRSHVVSTPK